MARKTSRAFEGDKPGKVIPMLPVGQLPSFHMTQ
jgi:hypothetical protein